MSGILPKISQLQAFRAVSQMGSINGASRSLGIPQPTLSRTLRELEEQLNVQLLVRGRHGITLTPAGERFARHASSIVNELEKAASEAVLYGGDEKSAVSRLSIGLSPVTANSILDAALGRLMRSEASCRVSIESAPLEVTAERVADGRLDFAVGNGGADIAFSRFVVEPLMSTGFAVVCAKGHPLAHAKTLEELHGADWWVTGEFRVCLKEREDFRRLEIRHSVHTRSHGVGIPLVMKEGFLALLSAVQIHRYRDKLEVIPIENLNVTGRYVLIYPRDTPLTQTARRMIDYLHEEAKAYDWDPPGVMAQREASEKNQPAGVERPRPGG